MTKLSSKMSYSRQKARKKMENYLDVTEPLPPNCHVHHRDGNPFNNDIGNLRIMGAGEHIRFHLLGKKQAIKKDLNILESLLTWYNVECVSN